MRLDIDSGNGLPVKTFFNKLCPGISYLIWQNSSLLISICLYIMYVGGIIHIILIYIIYKDICICILQSSVLI